ncbi:MAG: hypothetical protein V3V60_08730 [Sphingomonas aquatilis]|jgi:hypothetical protein|uniref:hypothetical protein n=1 Tax=Sphingomonas aquatilis TaxID=93063 RepID=UPI002F2C46D3
MNTPDSVARDQDLLYGASAIAAHLRMTDKQVYHLHDQEQLPTFKIGKRVCARRSELEAHFARASETHRGPERRGRRTLSAAAAGRGGGDLAPAPASGASPALLYGHRAIAAHLGIPAADVTRLDAERRLPTYQDDGCTVASTAALDHWNSMKGGR